MVNFILKKDKYLIYKFGVIY